MRSHIAKCFVWVLLGCFLTSSASGQNHTDSLLKIIRAGKEDTVKVNTLNALAAHYLENSELQNAGQYTAMAATLAEKLDFKRGIRDAGINQGKIYNKEANAFMMRNNFSQGLKKYFAALRVYEKEDYKYGLASVNGNIGRFYWIKKNYKDALSFYMKALTLFESIGDSESVAGVYNNIGILFDEQGQPGEALQYYRKAAKKYQENGSRKKLVNLYFNIGFLYEDRGNYDEALANHLAALHISREISLRDGVAAAYTNIGDVYVKKGNCDTALKYYLLSLDQYRLLDQNESLAATCIGTGSACLCLKDYEKARQCFLEGLKAGQREESLPVQRDMYRWLAKCDSLSGNWKGALLNYSNYVIMRDSILNSEAAEEQAKTRLQYEYEKKEDSLKFIQQISSAKLERQLLIGRHQQQTLLLRENELLLSNEEKKLQQLEIEKNHNAIAIQKAANEKSESKVNLLSKEKAIQDLELRRQKQLKLYLLAGLVLLIFVGVFAYLNYRSKQQVRLLTLRNKISSDLHDDIGSTLSSISIFSQMAQEQNKEALPLLESIGENSRRMLDAMADIVWTINPENDQFEKIILRMRNFAYELLGAKNIDFEFIADEDVAKLKLSMEKRKNLYLIFKEAVNNMVKYSGANKAMISLKESHSALSMLIQDNGKGFNVDNTWQGNGLKNMKKRADSLGAFFRIQSTPGSGTLIELRITL